MTYEIKNHRVKTRTIGDTIYVWIYGTNDWLDLFTSAQCWPNKYGVHAGAWEAATFILGNIELWANILTAEKIKLGGISMGASIAEAMGWLLLLEYDFEEKDIQIVHSYAGYPVTRREPGFKILRTHTERDVVPKLFPWFRKSGKIDIIPGGGRWPLRFYWDHTHYETGEFFKLVIDTE